MNRPHVVVIGGGFAGLRTAVALADARVRVTVLEGRMSLGGRARSFMDPVSGEIVDNGQHLFLGGYKETLSFLRRLGTDDRMIFQRRLRVTFVQPGHRRSVLSCPAAPAPWHLLLGVAGLSSLSVLDKLGFRRVARVVREFSDGNSDAGEQLDRETVESWLIRLGQSERARAAFWNPLAVATLNEDPTKASALGLMSVLRTLLFGRWPEARLGMAAVGLSELYTDAARQIVEGKGGEVLVNRPVADLKIADSRVVGVRLADGTVLTPELVVSSLPPAALSQILPQDPSVEADPVLGRLSRFTTSPIISINLWFDEPITKALFVGFIGTKTQWLFNKEAILAKAGVPANYLTLIISAAHGLIEQPKDKIVSIALQDLRACFPRARKARLIRSQVVREREATVSLGVGTQAWRPGPRTGLSNLFLAGDWTDTGLPATIESAVVSGRICAETVLKELASLPLDEYNKPIIC